MNASDVMTKNVLSVGPETPTRAVAKLLLDKGISAVPVVDATGAAVGMVSEGDLVQREIKGRASSRDWWLEMLAEGDNLATEFLDYLRAADRPVREVMRTPVVGSRSSVAGRRSSVAGSRSSVAGSRSSVAGRR
jgi:CBS domain-containing protein